MSQIHREVSQSQNHTFVSSQHCMPHPLGRMPRLQEDVLSEANSAQKLMHNSNWGRTSLLMFYLCQKKTFPSYTLSKKKIFDEEVDKMYLWDFTSRHWSQPLAVFCKHFQYSDFSYSSCLDLNLLKDASFPSRPSTTESFRYKIARVSAYP